MTVYPCANKSEGPTAFTAVTKQTRKAIGTKCLIIRVIRSTWSSYCRRGVSPLEVIVTGRNLVHGCVFISHSNKFVGPIAEWVKQFTIYQIAHVNGTGRLMIFNIVELVE